MQATRIFVLSLLMATPVVSRSQGVSGPTGSVFRLRDFGPADTPAGMRTVFQQAVEFLGQRGGILFLSPEESRSLRTPNTFQSPYRIPPPPAPARAWGIGPGFTIVESEEKTTTIKPPPLAGLQVDRVLRMNSSESLPHWTTDHAIKINNHLIHGANSYLEWIVEPVSKGQDCRFYVPTIRGLRPGQFLTAHGGPGYAGAVSRLYVKSLGYDPQKKGCYFTADTDIDHVAGAIVHNKNNVGVLYLNQTCNTDEQTYDIMLRRRQYAGGDTYMFFGWYEYMSDIHSAAGDENGTIFGGYVKSLLNNFRAQVERVNWDEKTLRFKSAQNVETLGNSRPLINLNPEKWITAGKVYIVPAESYWETTDTGQYPYKGRTYPTRIVVNPRIGMRELRMGGLIRGDPGCPWDERVIGRFFAVTEPTEAIEGDRFRWYEITGVSRNPDGTKDLTIRRYWWGAKEAGSPTLYREDNYTWDGHERPLSYAIAPGVFVNDVSRAVPSDGYKTEPVLGLAPYPDSETSEDFANGDPVEQAIGPDPFKPIPFRMWMWDRIPGAFPAPVLDVANYGVQRHVALHIRGGPGNLEDLPSTKEQKAPWENGILFESVADKAIHFKADVRDAALFFAQTYREQPIQWCYGHTSNRAPKRATLIVSRDTGDLHFSGGARLEGSVGLKGLSGDETPARNLRGKNVAVPPGQDRLDIVFPVPEVSDQYAVFLEQNWLTERAVVRKEAGGFTVQFSNPAPDGARMDWLLVR